MRQRLLFALSFAFGASLAGTGSAAAWDPSREELMGLTLGVFGGFLLLLTLIYAVKWYFGLDVQPPIDFPEPHAGNHDESASTEAHARADEPAATH